MRKTILGLAAIVIISLLLQSCFEIKEIIKINKDGSGTFSMVIDMSEVKAMLESFSEGEDGESESPLSAMEEEYETTRGKLEVIKGVSNISFQTENDGYLITTSFDFDNIDALNRGINVVYDEGNEVGPQNEYYKYKKKNFERTAVHKLLNDMKDEMESGEMAGEDMDLGEIFSDVAFINEVTFTDRTIKKTSKEAIEVSEDGSTMTLKRFIFRDDEDLSMDYSLKLK